MTIYCRTFILNANLNSLKKKIRCKIISSSLSSEILPNILLEALLYIVLVIPVETCIRILSSIQKFLLDFRQKVLLRIPIQNAVRIAKKTITSVFYNLLKTTTNSFEIILDLLTLKRIP